MSKTEDVIEPIQNLKTDRRIQKFMVRYRHNYDIHMVTELSKLAYQFYLEGYNNGLKQYPVVAPTNTTEEGEIWRLTQ